jgi:hypothetical protein
LRKNVILRARASAALSPTLLPSDTIDKNRCPPPGAITTAVPVAFPFGGR